MRKEGNHSKRGWELCRKIATIQREGSESMLSSADEAVLAHPFLHIDVKKFQKHQRDNRNGKKHPECSQFMTSKIKTPDM